MLTDPNNELCPDYTLAEHAPIRALLATGNTTDDQAADLLKALWTAKNDKDKAAWQTQLTTDAAAWHARQQQHKAKSAAREATALMEREVLAKEERKRNRDKYIPIPLDRAVPMQPHNVLSTYATRKLDKGHYLELWFVTNDGLESAHHGNLCHDQDTMTVTQKEDGSVSWEPTAQAPRGVIDDEDLPWEDFCTVCPLFIKATEDAHWPSERINMMSGLFYAVQTHPWRRSRDLLERRALLVYTDEQRRLWHAAIDSAAGGYNISIFNEAILRATHDRIYREDRITQDAAAHYATMYVIHLIQEIHNTNISPPPSFPVALLYNKITYTPLRSNPLPTTPTSSSPHHPHHVANCDDLPYRNP
ncbi:hypothetical protein FIBSPDRAFT_751416 [Athelia psychrophila]|uniref:Uncharacterized protein n=1 Tax=Athelia psychrophila TaxID=1759441 RepID=A0A166DH73_9AGAM|nr:hypothetical protein FIBSPDRAFT_751416 [Fibularhizoctonia sp. CBS 109695]